MPVRVAPDPTRELEPVHLGHQHVDGGDIELVALLDELQSIRRTLDRYGLHSPRPSLPAHDLAIGRVVVHDQDALGAEHRPGGV